MKSKEEEACDNDVNNSEGHDDLEEEFSTTDLVDIINCREFRTDDLLHNLKHNLCLFILKLREKHCIAATVQFSIVENLKVIFEEFTTHYTEILRFHLRQQHQIDTDDDDDLTELLNQQNVFDECLKQISSEWMLERYCEDELEYIAPVQVPLDQTEQHGAHFQYIPLQALLRKIVQNEDVWAMLNQEEAPKHQDIMEDYTDGDQFKSSHLTSLSSLRLHFYIDEFEIVNPLGSKKGKHKLTAVYFKLGNIDKKYTSKLENIYLSSLIRHRFIEEDLTNYNNLFQPLIEEVRHLETEGVTLSCNGESRRFYGTIVTISADNLSAHSLIGLKRNFSHGRICRFCMATKDNIAVKFREEDFTLRDSANYKYHLQAVCENPDLGNVYGVLRECCFSSLNYAPSLITHLFPPDVMHDVLEGVIPKVLRLTLYQLIQDKQITLAQLNFEIENFSYSVNDKSSKPQTLTERMLRTHLSGKASETWTLFRLLPLMVGSYVPPNKYWNCYILLREVVDVIMAPVVRRSWIPYLEEKISEFLSTFQKIFPDGVTPKMHFLVHYPSLLLKYGPLVNLSCMRFEAKHQYFKKVSTVVCNFKNITKTLARRHQLRQCWEQAEKKSIGYEVCNASGSSEVPSNTLPSLVLATLETKVGKRLSNEVLQKTNSITVNNTNYKTGECKVIDTVHTEEIPIFFKIMAIYGYIGLWYMFGKILTPLKFDSHLHAYKVTEASWCALEVGDELAYHGLDSYKDLEGNVFIPLRHTITKH